MCDPITMGVGTFASGAFGAIGAANQAKARNRARMQNYKHQLNVREHEWYQQLSIWGAQRNKYFQDLTENDLAAQRGYSQAQVGMNEQFSAAAQRNEGALIKYLQESGKLAAAGRTGRSIKRIGTLDLGALERDAGRTYWKLTQSREAYKANVESIRNQQLSNRNQLSANVAFSPVPDLAPPPPQMENQSPAMGLMSAAFGGLTSYMEAGGKFGRNKGNFASSFQYKPLENNLYNQDLGTIGNFTNTSAWSQISPNNYSGPITDSFADVSTQHWVTK